MLEYKPFLKIREKQKFTSLKVLKKQIREDKRYAKVRFSKMRWS
ncbi:riboflavin kinase [Priestia megaterium]